MLRIKNVDTGIGGARACLVKAIVVFALSLCATGIAYRRR